MTSTIWRQICRDFLLLLWLLQLLQRSTASTEPGATVSTAADMDSTRRCTSTERLLTTAPHHEDGCQPQQNTTITSQLPTAECVQGTRCQSQSGTHNDGCQLQQDVTLEGCRLQRLVTTCRSICPTKMMVQRSAYVDLFPPRLGLRVACITAIQGAFLHVHVAWNPSG